MPYHAAKFANKIRIFLRIKYQVPFDTRNSCPEYPQKCLTSQKCTVITSIFQERFITLKKKTFVTWWENNMSGTCLFPCDSPLIFEVNPTRYGAADSRLFHMLMSACAWICEKGVKIAAHWSMRSFCNGWDEIAFFAFLLFQTCEEWEKTLVFDT